MISFRAQKHVVDHSTVIEILWHGVPCAVMYPMPKGVKIISAHIDGEVVTDNGEPNMPIPAVHINFDPGPYSIEGGKIVKHR